MKGTLEFNLPEDAGAFEACKNGIAWRSVVRDIDEFLRREAKHNENEEAERFRSVLREIMGEKEVYL